MQKEEYLLLIHKYLSHQISRDEQEHLDRWLAENARHRRMMEEMKLLWEAEDDYQPLTEGERRAERSRLQHQITATSNHRPSVRVDYPFARLGAAAILILGIILAAWHLFQRPVLPTSHTVRIAQQERTTVTLPDSSTVQVENSSILSFSSLFHERTVHLQGEAFFDVTPDEIRPFSVILPEATLQVVGTSFRVRAYPEEVQTVVSVVSGRVRVYNQYDTILVGAGQQSAFDQQSRTWALSDETNLTALVDKGNQLEFDAVPLNSILATLEDRYGVKFIVESPDLLACRFTGSFGQDQLHEVLEILSFSLQFDYRYQDQQYIIQGQGCP